MTAGDIGDVIEVDRESYALPWPAGAYRRELNNNQQARYIVLRGIGEDEGAIGADEPQHQQERRPWRARLPWFRPDGRQGAPGQGRIIGYAGMWIVADEAHITTVAVRTANRGHGFGELLLASLIDIAYEAHTRWVTLEVRVSNEVAQNLYRKYGLRKAGLRRRYYSDNNEDAVIMTTDDITLNAYRAQFEELKDQLAGRMSRSPAMATDPPALGLSTSMEG